MNTVSITCCKSGCGYSPFPMEQGFYERARRTHEWWYCPAGHTQHFVGATEEEKRHQREVEELKAEVVWVEKMYDRADEESKRCPWPTCRDYVYASRSSMYEHMRRQHAMPLLAVVQEAS